MDLERRIIGIGGTDAVTFLQGLTSNDMRPLAEADGLVYTALLSPQGKYLADFFVGRQAVRDEKTQVGIFASRGPSESRT